MQRSSKEARARTHRCPGLKEASEKTGKLLVYFLVALRVKIPHKNPFLAGVHNTPPKAEVPRARKGK